MILDLMMILMMVDDEGYNVSEKKERERKYSFDQFFWQNCLT